MCGEHNELIRQLNQRVADLEAECARYRALALVTVRFERHSLALSELVAEMKTALTGINSRGDEHAA